MDSCFRRNDGGNIESVPSEAGPDLNGIEQGITNDEVEIATSRASHAPRNDIACHLCRSSKIFLPPEERRSFAIFSASLPACAAGPLIRRLIKFLPCKSDINAQISISSPSISAKAPTGA